MDSAMAALARHCPGLISVDLESYGGLTDAAVLALGALPGPIAHGLG